MALVDLKKQKTDDDANSLFALLKKNFSHESIIDMLKNGTMIEFLSWHEIPKEVKVKGNLLIVNDELTKKQFDEFVDIATYDELLTLDTLQKCKTYHIAGIYQIDDELASCISSSGKKSNIEKYYMNDKQFAVFCQTGAFVSYAVSNCSLVEKQDNA